jgi:proteasome assembly chaperone (PAC2) family protein
LKIQFVPRSKHYVSVIQTSQLKLYREIIDVCSQIHTKHINTLCGQNIQLLNVKLAVLIVTSGLQTINNHEAVAAEDISFQ